MFVLLVLSTLLFGAQGASNVEDVIDKSYPAEYHNVTTSDGYILGLHRIPHGKGSGNNGSGRKVVFLMHGLQEGANSFTYLGPDYAIAYSLADAGCDVWLGNTRGNEYSRRHVSLDPDQDSKKFYDFTFHEIAMYDLPAMLDYVLEKTQQEKLYYIGHSQGGTTFLILNSLTDAYHSKIASAHLLDAVGYEKHYPNKRFKLLSYGIDVIYSVALLAGFVELKPSSPVTQIFLKEFLGVKALLQPLLKGAAFKQAVHYCQNFRDEAFRNYDYGRVTNLVQYGRPTPPSYDLSKVNIDVTLHYGPNPTVLSEADTLAMAKALPKATARRVASDDFGHTDYLISKNVKTLVTDYIIKSWQKS